MPSRRRNRRRRESWDVDDPTGISLILRPRSGWEWAIHALHAAVLFLPRILLHFVR